MRVSAALICLLVLSAACAAAAPGPRPATGDQLYEAVVDFAASPALAVIDSSSRSAARSLDLGVPSPDWKHLYSIQATSLVDTDPRTGAVQNSVQLGGTYRLPAATANGVPGGLSPDGRWLVIESAAAQRTSMLIVDTTAFKVARRVALAGDFEFDAISDTGDNLYLIQRVSSGSYYVRLYDVAAGALAPYIVADKSDGDEAMAGLRLSGVASRDHGWLFSMYVREHEPPFIHALSLGGPFALCLDLPGKGYLDDPSEMDWSLAMSRDGSDVYAVNPATGAVVAVSTGGRNVPSILRTQRFQASPGRTVIASNAALVDERMLVAGGDSGVVWIDATNLTLTSRVLDGWAIAGIALSPDGKTLYAVGAGGQVAAISTATRKVTATFDPSAGAPMALMRVAAA